MARQNFVGLVVSQGKMHKTVKVRVQTKIHDAKINKDVFKRKDYLVHDEGNLCKEGDIVRIESIPKISARKFFAVAEIKVDKGQQFALYEKLAQEKVAQEESQLVKEFVSRRENLQRVITKIEDLKALDRIVHTAQTDPDASREALVKQINEIKQKYNIDSWPTDKPVLDLELTSDKLELAEMQTRETHIHRILDALMSDENAGVRKEILSKVAKKNVDELKPGIQKNILRKYVLDVRNEVPIKF